MLVNVGNGFYHLTHNFRNAFDEQAFMDKYLEECFDKDLYIIGDIAAGILRLKGFNNDPKSENYCGNLNEYFEKSCVIGSPYYILKRLNENEYNKMKSNDKLHETKTDGFTITPLEKINFDKESLELVSNPKEPHHIEIDVVRANSMPKGKLPDDLKEIAIKEAQKEPVIFRNAKPDVQTESTTYVSSSNGFDPSKVNRNNRGFNNRPNKNNNQKNNNNQKKNNNNNNHNNKKNFNENK